jgi:hypothetical protein
VIWPNGRTCAFGEVVANDPRLDVVVRLSGALTPWKLALNPDLHLGEAYMNGTLVLEQSWSRGGFAICSKSAVGMCCKAGARLSWRGLSAVYCVACNSKIP